VTPEEANREHGPHLAEAVFPIAIDDVPGPSAAHRPACEGELRKTKSDGNRKWWWPSSGPSSTLVAAAGRPGKPHDVSDRNGGNKRSATSTMSWGSERGAGSGNKEPGSVRLFHLPTTLAHRCAPHGLYTELLAEARRLLLWTRTPSIVDQFPIRLVESRWWPCTLGPFSPGRGAAFCSSSVVPTMCAAVRQVLGDGRGQRLLLVARFSSALSRFPQLLFRLRSLSSALAVAYVIVGFQGVAIGPPVVPPASGHGWHHQLASPSAFFSPSHLAFPAAGAQHSRPAFVDLDVGRPFCKSWCPCFPIASSGVHPTTLLGAAIPVCDYFVPVADEDGVVGEGPAGWPLVRTATSSFCSSSRRLQTASPVESPADRA